jgi:hypothetical protein
LADPQVLDQYAAHVTDGTDRIPRQPVMTGGTSRRQAIAELQT